MKRTDMTGTDMNHDELQPRHHHGGPGREGTEIEDTTLGNKPKEAQINRELLNLADQLVLAASLVRNQYWTGKGLLSFDLR